MTRRPGALVAATLFAISSAPAGALAQTKQECVDAYTTAQVARRDNKLTEARARLVVCANAACPAALRKDCVPWLAEVEAALPTVAIKPVDETGQVVDGATVTIDGRDVAREGDFATTRLDPGEHVVRVEAAGMNAAEQKVTVAAGASRREVVVHLVRAAARASRPIEPEPEASRPIPTGSFVLAGIGVAGVGAFAVLGAIGKGKKGTLDQEGCKPNCKQSDVDAIKTDYIAADVALGVGGAALAGALIVFFARPAATPKTDASWSLAPRPGGAALFVRF